MKLKWKPVTLKMYHNNNIFATYFKKIFKNYLLLCLLVFNINSIK